MSCHRLIGSWKQVKGAVGEGWGKLTDDNVDVIAGNGDILRSKMQEKQGVAHEKTEEEIKAWEDPLK